MSGKNHAVYYLCQLCSSLSQTSDALRPNLPPSECDPQYQYSTPTAVWTRRVEGGLCSTVHAEMVARGLVRRNISTSSSYRLDDLNTSAMHFRVQSWLKVSWWLSLSFEMSHICSGIISRAALSARAP